MTRKGQPYANREDLSGRKFGTLKVVGWLHKKANLYWICECSCGIKVESKRDALIKGRAACPECRAKRIFWKRINIILDKTSCWEVAGFRHERGYGAARITIRGFRQSSHAHRLAYAYAKNDYSFLSDPFEYACHYCNNPPCCRPSHLHIDPPKINAEERDLQGRHRIHFARQKLTAAQVNEIRVLIKLEPKRARSIAKMYGIDKKSIYHIRDGISYTNIPIESVDADIDALRAKIARDPAQNPNLSLASDRVREIRELHATRRYSYAEIARRVGVDYQTTRNVLIGKYYSHVT